MSDVKEYLLSASEMVGETYQLQTKTFSSIEFPLLIELFNKNQFKTVLDIGTGEGNWIKAFSSKIEHVDITAIDADSKLIETAKKNHSAANIDFRHAMFNEEYSTQKYDCILARFSMEHVDNPDTFIEEVYKRLNPNGMFIVNEWFIDIYYSSNPIWKKYREKEDEVYEALGSHPRLALSLPSLYRKHGFTSILSSYHSISPSTVDKKSFFELTIAYAILFNGLKPNIFDDFFTADIIQYCKNSIENSDFTNDYYLITQTIGVRSS